MDYTADELAFQRYKAGEYTYDDYLNVCLQENCNPIPHITKTTRNRYDRNRY